MLKFTCSYDFLIFNKLPEKNPCENKIQYDINFTLYLDSWPLIIEVTPIFYFTTENDVRSYNPLVFSPHKFNYHFFFLKMSLLSPYYKCCTNGILRCTTDMPSQTGLLSVPASGG